MRGIVTSFIPMKNAFYKIERGVRLPPPKRAMSNGKPSKAAATMALLAKGESFVIRDALDALAAEKTMRDFNARERRRGERRVMTSRRTSIGVRIWRVR